jgi:MOSC domain-containing protein YiiM
VTLARLVSVNVGTPTVQPGSDETTGIVKLPRAGPVLIDAEGVVGDAIMNRKHHGGPDQAIYLYLTSDYDWWMEELGKPLEPGTFGENFTIRGIETSATLSVGDRFEIGGVVLEVTSHRTPCATFARRMHDPRWVRRFAKALRPGAYARVLTTGVVEAGMPVVYRPFAGERFTLAEFMALDGQRTIPEATMRRALATPVHWKTRAEFEAALAR